MSNLTIINMEQNDLVVVCHAYLICLDFVYDADDLPMLTRHQPLLDATFGIFNYTSIVIVFFCLDL